jgi:hypothetical protein
MPRVAACARASNHVNPIGGRQPARPEPALRKVQLAAERPNPIADELLARLPASPDVYPQAIDLVREAVLLIRFGAAAYRAASFLDDRILAPDTQGAWIPMDRVESASGRVPDPRRLHYIFHTGHVGSTLVSRLLDETGEVLSLREPLPLRTLADAHDILSQPESLLSEAQFERALATCIRLWRRGYGPTKRVVVKATSSTGRIAGALLEQTEGARAIYMNLRAEPYLATLLAGQNSPLDLRGHGPGRIRRLQARLALPLAPLHALSLGELAAMSWLSESLAQEEAVARHSGRVIALDFDRFLANLEEWTSVILVHFELCRDAGQVSGLARSPVLTQYSKAPDYAYTAAARAEILNQSREANRLEIRKGMAWLERIAQSDGGAAAVLHHMELRAEPQTRC